MTASDRATRLAQRRQNDTNDKQDPADGGYGDQEEDDAWNDDRCSKWVGLLADRGRDLLAGVFRV